MSLPRYPQYKASGVEWLGEIPEHWEVKRLKYVCQVMPSNVDKKSYEGEPPIRLCNYTDVYYNDSITSKMEFMDATASPEQIKKFTLRAGDTIITKDSETADDIAASAHVPDDLPGVVCGYHLAIVRPISEVSGAFVKRLFDSHFAKASVEVLANGLTRVALGQYDLDNLELPFPPPPEQTQIASFLDRETAKIDALVAEQERLIELLKEKRQAVISHAVTKGLDPKVPLKPSGIEWLGEVPAHWGICPLRYVISAIEQGWSPQCENAPAGEGEWGVLKVGCVNGDCFDPSENKELPADVQPLTELEVMAGDILMSRGNTPDLVGMATFVAHTRPLLLLSDLLYRFHARPERAENEFIALFLRSRIGRFQVERDAVGTSASMKKIGQDTIREIVVTLPPIEEQRAIIAVAKAKAQQLDDLGSEVLRAIALLQERRAVLISAAVTGQIDVRPLKGKQPA